MKTNDDKWAFIDDDEWALNNSSQTDSSMENSPESWKATCAYSVCTNKVKKWLQKEKQEPGNHVLNYIVSKLLLIMCVNLDGTTCAGCKPQVNTDETPIHITQD